MLMNGSSLNNWKDCMGAILRKFYFSTLCILCATHLTFGQLAPKGKNEKPNIIFIMSDDHASQVVSAYGGLLRDIAPTPNIDLLAKEGIRLNNVFCTNAICGPSRASILTGKYSNKNGFYKNENGGAFDSSQWTFPKALQKSGYKTALFGKWHLTSAPTGFDYFKYHDDPSQQGTYWDPVFNENGKKVVAKGYATNLTVDFALEWLDKNEKEEYPFCLLVQFKAPHRDWTPDTKYVNLFDGKEIPYPLTFNDDYRTREQAAGNTHMTMDYFSRKDMKLIPPDTLSGYKLANWNSFGTQPGENFSPDENMTDDEVRRWKYQRYIKDYLACVKSVDDNVGRLLAYLKENGMEDNTIVIYTSDQGFFLGEHGFFDKRFMYEESSRMPFLIKYKNVIPAGKVNTDIITNIDFAPTLLDMAGLVAPKNVQGRSFFQNLKVIRPGTGQPHIIIIIMSFRYGIMLHLIMVSVISGSS